MAIKQIETARRLAEATPASRNRYADFLRAVAILAVVFGHWLMAAVWVDAAGQHTANVLGVVKETQWLTWALQVMPIFFFVGGFSNWISISRTSEPYGAWLRGRLRRLVTPTIPLIAVWGMLGLFGPQVGIPSDLARAGSQTALIPLWFLAVYVLQVAATPLTAAIWRRYGVRAVAYSAVAAMATDAVRVATSTHVGFANYLFVWGAVYLLGHGWATGTFARPSRGAMLAVGAGLALVTMTILGPYHVSMVGVPGVEFGNTGPPSAALLALGLTQIGLAMALQGPLRRFLSKPGPWTATILVNSSIMTVYVWHMTAMTLTIGAMLAIGGPFAAIVPGTGLWWATRPLWIALLAVATVPFMAIFQRFERPSREGSVDRSTAGSIAIAVAICVSYTSVAAKGMTMQHPVWALAALLPLLPTWLWLKAAAERKELIAS